jgi:S1-C subfamily serine protease
MKRNRPSLKLFGVAVAGGLVALALAVLAAASGLIDVDNTDGDDATTVASAPLVSDSQPASGTARTVGQVYQEDGQGVAFIKSEQSADESAQSPLGPLPGGGGGTATGSGFLIDDAGHLLTNAHVVDGASSVTVKFGDGDELEAKVLGSDDSTDVAVLEVDPSAVSADPLELGDSGAVKVGDPAVAIGNPYGLDRTVTSGIISALQRQISAPNGFTISDVLQTDAAINPGNSGGPLIDAQGRVIGINSQIATGGSSTGSVGIGFAVPIETARTAAQQIIENGSVEHAYLGIAGADVDSALADALKLDVDQGALVQDVTPDGPADDAGLEAGDDTAQIEGAKVQIGGDVITGIDGEEVSGMDDLIAAIDSHQPGDEVTLDILRDGEQQQVDVTLGDRPANAPS